LSAELHDAGEEVAEEVKAQERAQWQWRLGCMGRPLPGAALEDSADDLKGIANYEGLCSCILQDNMQQIASPCSTTVHIHCCICCCQVATVCCT